MRNIYFHRANNVLRGRMNGREKGMARCNRILGVPRWFDDARKRDLTTGRALSREQRENRENSSGERITRRGRLREILGVQRERFFRARKRHKIDRSTYQRLDRIQIIPQTRLRHPMDRFQSIDRGSLARVSMALLANQIGNLYALLIVSTFDLILIVKK